MTARCGIASSAADDRGDPARRQHERVAAGDDDLPDLRPLRDIAERAVERRRVEQSRGPCRRLRGGSRSGNRPGRARSASAARGRDSDGRGRGSATSVVANRVSLVVARRVKFRRAWHELRRDRIGGVGGIDQRRHVVGNGDRKLCGDPAELRRAAPARRGRVRPDHRCEKSSGSPRQVTQGAKTKPALWGSGDPVRLIDRYCLD